VLVFIVENHSLDQMRGAMPFTIGLATTYAHADHYQALTHPSLPNYLAMIGGTTSGVTDDKPPAVHGLTGPSVFGQALAAGRTAGVYADGMPSPCALEDGGDRYAVRHNAWAYHLDERAACAQFDLPLTALPADLAAGALPNVGMVIPNTCHDAHDCSLGEADAWLQQQIGAVMAGPDWAAGRLAVVVTADEDDHDQDNLVLTVVAHPSLHGLVVHDPLTHLSLSRALSELAGGQPLADAATAPSLWDAFGLRPDIS
jgi:acid phosphatase